jgi:uncharacterized protein YegL
MISTRLLTTEQGILSHKFIPPNTVPLIERRLLDNKSFCKLELTVPHIDRFTSNDDKPAAAQPRNIVAGFLLDTSDSMKGEKLQHAKNTIKKFVEVLHAERNGKTIENQPIHSWFYLITFNSKTQVVIPFQEITEETVPKINEQLDSIRTDGCTNYELAFQKQTEVLDEIIRQLVQKHEGDQTQPQYHFMRFFETDGEITQGSHNISKLYNMMRTTFVPTSAIRLTFEDCVLGYGTDVDLGCLKALASPYPPVNISADEIGFNCSSLVAILQPQDIGWQVGEILFKLIMRYECNIQVSVSASVGTIEIFEYQTHQWSASTKLHSLIHGEKKNMWLQYTPVGASLAKIPVQVKIQYTEQFSGNSMTHTFDHIIDPSPVVPPQQIESISQPFESTVPFQQTISLILGMIQIEIFKQFREVEANRYDRDTIVHEAYKIKRMLNSLKAIAHISFPILASQIQNLMTDVKVIIGLTTIQNNREQNLVLHARRVCSAEQDVFNTGSAVSRKYVEFEEDFEEEAKRIIDASKANGDQAFHDSDEELDDDTILSRIPTCMTQTSNESHRKNTTGSILRTLCAKIAHARNKKEDISAQQLYEQMRHQHLRYDTEYDPDQLFDDTFSSTPADDVYTQCRMGMMRQMSS